MDATLCLSETGKLWKKHLAACDDAGGKNETKRFGRKKEGKSSCTEDRRSKSKKPLGRLHVRLAAVLLLRSP